MQTTQKYIKFGTGTDGVNARLIPANISPTNYTPTAAGSEATTQTSAHLKGIDTKLAIISNDIAQTTFNFVNNQSAAADVTGLAFANASIRSASILLTVVRGATYAQYTIDILQKASSWVIGGPNYTGDDTGITFSITATGQVQYISTNTGAGGTFKFRASVITVQLYIIQKNSLKLTT